MLSFPWQPPFPLRQFTSVLSLSFSQIIHVCTCLMYVFHCLCVPEGYILAMKGNLEVILLTSFFNPHLRICLLILDGEEGDWEEKERETQRERERQRERLREREEEEKRRTSSVWQRNIDKLFPSHAPTGGWTGNLLVYGTTLQITGQPSQSC